MNSSLNQNKSSTFLTHSLKSKDLEKKYAELRKCMMRLKTSNYDISNICNLRCEGCLYFSGESQENLEAIEDVEQWRNHFKNEAKRGINFAYIAGAEPSLTSDRIQACHESIPYGVIFTNGSRRISSQINYRIHVSLWGNDERSKLYRDGSMNHKALQNYKEDSRAIFVMTVNNLNIMEIEEVTSQCEKFDTKLTFSFFSPTTEYNDRISGLTLGNSKYFRISSKNDNMKLSAKALQVANKEIFKAQQKHPDTVKVSAPFINWVTSGHDLYSLDENGIAKNCGNRLTKDHLHFNPDITNNSGKCCSPNLDCKDCRAYAMSMASYLTQFRRSPRPSQAHLDWLNTWEHWVDLFMPCNYS